MLDALSLSRLKWRSRRGLLENDLVLAGFFEKHAAGLDEQRALGLEALLALDDGDLWDLIAGRAEPAATLAADARAVLAELRAGGAPAPRA
ncbi:MAG: succinate dehydrogenase assembly factor 2 [Burkholderiales bacterium]|nr:succinate dehydrogenase assembly factor 2 [Burkholderiales bacterium]